ncbi:hypothetical protein JDXMQMMX_CDS36 [Acinetobacter phage vB_AbaM_AB4P2]|nr:hypothetical protein JDXMQMMX_CDS36 [Acinetobacter phage vB_AbaM_AB4P2]
MIFSSSNFAPSCLTSTRWQLMRLFSITSAIRAQRRVAFLKNA